MRSVTVLATSAEIRSSTCEATAGAAVGRASPAVDFGEDLPVCDTGVEGVESESILRASLNLEPLFRGFFSTCTG